MRRALRRQGFLEVSATPERKHDDAKKVVDLDVAIVPGAQYAMGKLTIEGLDIQTEPYIRKLWTLAEGKPFNAEYPDFFLKEIREKQLMDDLGETKSIPTVDEARRTVDVKLIFKAAPVPQKKKPL
jgi:outer membrane protein assembly factor BamA